MSPARSSAAEFGARLREHRRSRGLSQCDLGGDRFTGSYISHLESGRRTANQRFRFEASHVDELRALTPPSITRPERYGAVIAKGDEVLDWHEMHDRYAGSTMRLVDGSDHGLSDFDDHLPFVLRSLGLMS